MAYSPPIGNAANFNFSVTPYTAPAGNAVNFDFESFDVSVAESVSAASTQNATAILRPTVNETASAVDHPVPNVVRRVTVSESMSVADHPGSVYRLTVNEAMTAASAQNGSNVSTLAVHETLHAADTILSGIRPHVDEVLNILAHATAAVNGAWALRVHEINPITQVANGHSVIHASVVEDNPIHAYPTESTGGVHNVTARAFADADDTASSHMLTHSIVHETLSVLDSNGVQIGTPGTWNLSVVEHANITVSATDPLTFTSTGLRFWGYRYAYQRVPGNVLSVWCAGLDCGDHAIDASGFVFVPWESDPDGLFTPAWLFQLHNSPPDPLDALTHGFGASACNIDLTDNNGDMHRLIVDLAIGLCYRSEVQVLRPNSVDANHSQFGPSLAETRRLHQYGAHFVNAQGVEVGTTDGNLQPATFREKNGAKYPAHKLFTGVHWGHTDDDYSYDGMLMMQMFRPYPATIAAMIGFMKTMDRD